MAENDPGTVREHGAGDSESLSAVLNSAFDTLSEATPAAEGVNDPGDPPADPSTDISTDPPPDDPPADPPPDDPPADPPPEAAEAPAHWPSADREMFAKQTPEAQKWLMGRQKALEGDYTRKMQEVAPYRQLNERWQPYFQQLGASAPQAIDLLLQTEYQLRTGSQEKKLDVIRDLIRDYGIEAPGGDGGGTEAGAQDPRYDALHQQFQQMQASQQERDAQVRQQQQAAQQAQLARAGGAIQSFASEKGADGRLAHPHFGEVQDEMTRLAQADLAAGVQPDLKSLYDRAIWANPTVRSQLQVADKAAEAERKKAEVAKAKKAGGQISGSGGAAAEQPKGLRDTLEAEWDRQAAAA